MTDTPMMAQWALLKKEAKEALLLFRLGDFYEAFYEDAEKISKEINLTLTARQSIPMCGVPYHTSEVYIDKLIAKGYKIAIAEQTEDPKAAKGLVKREIVRVVTPGTIIRSNLLQDKKNNYFSSIVKIGTTFGLSSLDLTTGEFWAFELDTIEELFDELYRMKPKEFLAAAKFQEQHPLFFKELSHSFSFVLNTKEALDPKLSLDALLLHFDLANLEPLGLKGQNAAISAAGSLLLYLKEELSLDLAQITSIQSENLSEYMAIDRSTLRHLEITESLFDLSGKNTLLETLDETSTPMGGRLLQNWLKHPLLSAEKIQDRQKAVLDFLSFSKESLEVENLLKQMRDLERIMAKIQSRHANPRDLLALGLSLSQFPALKKALAPFPSSEIQKGAADLFDALPLAEKIVSSLLESPPIRLGEGGIFKDGYHEELDQLRLLAKDSMSWMARYQTTLREETGIKTLRVGYTKAFGYYIEMSRSSAEKAPSSFMRRQTLVNTERFITEELKTFEHQVLTAEERSKALEEELFDALRKEAASYASPIQKSAKAIAKLDVLFSFAKAAKKRGFIQPTVDASDILEIEGGRHPIVEASIGKASFIPNDTFLNKENQMMLITGPNMAGKSTYIRQVALIVILAQIGSFVPAKRAHIGLVDKVFSRIGASDDLSRGHSTFMVEMSETAHILNNATSRSLVLLDEIGRGTSTYDGIAIAWAVAEFLLTAAKKQAKTLFATHYWELTRLSEEFSTVSNFQIAVEEAAANIVFLRKIVKGGTDKSYGIHVAKLAGLPAKAIKKAEEILLQLEAKAPRKKIKLDEQLPLFSPPAPSPLLQEIQTIDLNAMTPLQALEKLFEWQKKLSNAL